MQPLQAKDLEILRHMTGSDFRYKKSQHGFRNYFCSPLEGPSYEALVRLEENLLVVRGRQEKELIYFYATELGCKMIGLHKAAIKRAMNRD